MPVRATVTIVTREFYLFSVLLALYLSKLKAVLFQIVYQMQQLQTMVNYNEKTVSGLGIHLAKRGFYVKNTNLSGYIARNIVFFERFFIFVTVFLAKLDHSNRNIK